MTKLLPLSLLFMLSAAVQAQVNYVITGDTAYVSNSPDASGNISIAPAYNGYPVTSIGYDAFGGCAHLTSVTIPDSVISIGDSAFDYCAGLTNVTIPDSVTSIGENAFEGCSSLTNVTIPDSVTSIEDYAFQECSSLTTVTIPDGITIIREATFYGCFALTNITIPNSVTIIGDAAFEECIGLTSVTIPGNVTSIGNWAFAECFGLTSITIPKSVTFIGDYAFAYSSLTGASPTSACFQGNAPPDDGTIFDGDDATVYYYYGTSGWGATYGGAPTVMLGAPAPQVGNGSIEPQSGRFRFTLTGVTNQTVMIEASTNLVNWQPIWTNTLSGPSTNFTDAQWTNYPGRFYRASSP